MKGKLFIVSAPSGAGKTTLVNEILVRLQPKFLIDRLVTYTSREIREGEKQGKDFFYISASEFEMCVQKGFFLEWNKYGNHYYGSPKTVQNDLLEGKSRILVIDRNGAKQVINYIQDPVLIWIYTQSLQDLKQRLIKRGTNNPEQIKKRLEIAKSELEEEKKTKFYKHHICNDIFIETAKKLEFIFLRELLR